MRAGKDNVRSVRQGGTDPQLWAMAGLLGVVVATVGTIRLGLAAQAALTGQDQVVPGNPITAAVQVIRGELQWTSVATAAAIGLWVVIGAGVFVVLWVRTAKPRARVDAAAKWMAPRRDIESMSRAAAEKSAEKWLPAGMAQTHPGLRLGRVPRTNKGLWSSWEDLYLIIFGPRMGKTTTQVIPAIVDAPGPVITTSNKRDIIDDTIGVTAARGQVWAFDPQRIAAGFEQRPWYYDPLSLIRRDPAVMDSASMELADIFRSAARGEDSGGDAFFSDGGRDLLSRLLLAAALDGRPIGEVFRWANDDSDRTPVGILARFPEWEQQAAATQTINRALEYLRTPEIEHTGNQWKDTDNWRADQKISNRVYQMTCSIWEDTKYNRETKQSVPIAWYVTWEVRIHSPKQGYGAKIAGQNQKRYTDKNAAIKYLDGRKKAYSHLFTEISPPIPKGYEHHFMVHGTLLPGYTVEGLEQAKTEHAAAEVSEGGIFTPQNREKPSVLGKLSVAKTQEKTPAAPGTAMKKKEDIQL